MCNRSDDERFIEHDYPARDGKIKIWSTGVRLFPFQIY